MVVATQLRRSPDSVPHLIPISSHLTPKSLPCHTSGNSPVSPSIATLPKTRVSKPNVWHTCETAGGHSQVNLLPILIPYALFPCPPIPLYFQTLADSPTQRRSRNPLLINHFRTVFIATEGVPPPALSQSRMLGYLLMSSFASSRFSNGWRNGFVASGAPLIAIVISLAAAGKSPVFDEIRASARWLVQ